MPSIPLTADFERDYQALIHGAGLVDFNSRTQIELTGNDRGTFLHNFCTNAVRGLPLGNGCEAFVLNAKGHIIGHVFVFAGENSHVVETVPGQAEKLLAHFDRYLIREDVQLHDRSEEWAEVLLAGPQLEVLLANQGISVPAKLYSHSAATVGGHELWLRRVEITGTQNLLAACRREVFDEVLRSLLEAGAVQCGDEAFNAARIEHGSPISGQDITEENLPQEVGRDKTAISFTKGCYLGQETVARIDALGHVNRLLRGVRFLEGEVPGAGTELLADGKPVGKVTSSCWSPKLNAPLALAYLKRGTDRQGTKLTSAVGPALVEPLPLK